MFLAEKLIANVACPAEIFHPPICLNRSTQGPGFRVTDHCAKVIAYHETLFVGKLRESR